MAPRSAWQHPLLPSRKRLIAACDRDSDGNLQLRRTGPSPTPSQEARRNELVWTSSSEEEPESEPEAEFGPKDPMDKFDSIIRWSPNRARDEFLHVNFERHTIKIQTATGHARLGRFDYAPLYMPIDLPKMTPYTTYDWSPIQNGLVAVGTSNGEVQLLKADDTSYATLNLSIKLQRSCQSVAFNNTGLLAVGLDRVRNDSCLQIWDVNQCMAGWDHTKPGSSASITTTVEPLKRLEASVSVASVRFFEDQPQTLVAGIKSQGCIRIHDLRDPNSAVISFQTRCNNNIAINHAEPHYFASSAVDSSNPGFVIWDKRYLGRHSCSEMYLEAVDSDGYPPGAALNKNTYATRDRAVIKQLRFSRECSGLLGVLSKAGELQVYQIKNEFVEPGSRDDVKDSPCLLQIDKSTPLCIPVPDTNHPTTQEDRIVSFDWMNIGNKEFEPRVLALKANGEYEVLSMPSASAGHIALFVPAAAAAPHKLDTPYMELMKFNDPKEQEAHLGPLHATTLMADKPIFGNESFKNPEVAQALKAEFEKAVYSATDIIFDSEDPANKEATHAEKLEKLKSLQLDGETNVDVKGKGKAIWSNRERHDADHYATHRARPGSKAHHEILDHIMLQRALDGYLFNCNKNIKLTEGDLWLQDCWMWIRDAERAAADDGMVAGPLILDYMGVYTIWNHNLGEKKESRLIDTTTVPDSSEWDNLLSGINSRAGNPEFVGTSTSKPQHRALCLATLGLAKPEEDFSNFIRECIGEGRFTCAAASALMEGQTKLAVDLLKGGGARLIPVAMALHMKLATLNSPYPLELDADWIETIEQDINEDYDVFLHIIYNFITTGSWDAIANLSSLALRSRVGVALRYFDDDNLTAWLEKTMTNAIEEGDIEGIVLAGITDGMVDIFAKYVDKFMDYQTPTLIMSFCYPLYITDVRLDGYKATYKALLNRYQAFIPRVHFEVQATKKSRDRNFKPTIPIPPRQVTIRCLKCDANAANDLGNTGTGQKSSSSAAPDIRNPLQATGINAGLSCPKCGSTLPRCAVCMDIVGMPRSDRPEQNPDPEIRRMSKFPTFCLKCKHVCHLDHADAWFKRHNECPVPECKCICNEEAIWDRGAAKWDESVGPKSGAGPSADALT